MEVLIALFVYTCCAVISAGSYDWSKFDDGRYGIPALLGTVLWPMRFIIFLFKDFFITLFRFGVWLSGKW